MSISWSAGVPLKVKSSADLYQHVLELYKNGVATVFYIPLVLFDSRCLWVQKYIMVLAENMAVPGGSTKICKQFLSNLAGITARVEHSKCEVPLFLFLVSIIFTEFSLQVFCLTGNVSYKAVLRWFYNNLRNGGFANVHTNFSKRSETIWELALGPSIPFPRLVIIFLTWSASHLTVSLPFSPFLS